MNKLVYIANARIPTEKAHGLQVMKMCEAFAGQGVDVELVIPRRINSIKKDPFDFYDVKKVFKMKRLWCLDFLWLPLLKGFSFWLQSLSFANSVLWLALFNHQKAFYTRDSLVAALLSAGSAKVFFEIHSVPNRGDFLNRLIWKRVAGLIAISNGIKTELIRQGIMAEKILVARDAVDPAQFFVSVSQEEAREQLGLPVDKKIILYTGHLYDWKGVNTLSEAAGQIKDADVYLVGGTAEDVNKYKVKYRSPNLKIIGWQEPRLIPLWLRAADLLVLPNSAKEKIGSEYTSPLKLFEYMASGTPMIVSRVPALEEVVSSKEVLFFAADNSGDLVEKIAYGFKNNDELIQKAKFAQEKAKEYTWNKRAQKILNFIS